MILLLIRRFLADRPWQFALAVTLCALGLASAISIIWMQSLIEAHARRQAQGIDIVVGAKGSALQNVLAAVYYLDVPNGNIRLADVDRLRANPQIARAIPIAMGDSVAGARIVGTTPEFAEFYGATTAVGELPKAPMDAAIGAAVASRTGLKVGDSFIGAHGLGSGDTEAGGHDAYPYRVSGILKPTGRVIDQTVVTPIESVWLVHQEHAASPEPEATFALLQVKGPVAMATLPRLINQQSGLQAAVPAMESARLLASFDWVALIVKVFAVVLVIAAMASLLGALLQALTRREPELALMRAMGASRGKLTGLLLSESLVLVAVSALIAALLVAGGVWALQTFALPGIGVDPVEGFLFWLGGLLAATLLAFIATIPVLWRSASIDVAAQLSSR
jgi:putative ABC transport system permease protein